jgi:hypothetical protein
MVRVACGGLLALAAALPVGAADDAGAAKVFPGADEKTPSIAHYFSWINQLDQGPTEAQTLANLGFFKYLKDEYGMQLDCYAWDEGALDWHGKPETMDSPRTLANFPHGFAACVAAARAIGTRMGLWGGADGFGDTAASEQARIDMYVDFCKTSHFLVFKFDAVRGDLRTEKQGAFARMLAECRKYCPDLIVLNHRLNLGTALPYATTSLWEGQETYVDVKIQNPGTATHNRVGAMARGVPPNLTRLVEDHGVCLSSCLDHWDDDLILQAFNRSLLLAPEIYGDPWFLRDDELPKLARIFNLHRRYGALLVSGIELPDQQYGPHAVSRGDDATRFITMRNLTWNPVTYHLKLDQSIGLQAAGQVTVRAFHPVEQDLGGFAAGATADITVAPFGASLLMASVKPIAEIGVAGCAYQVVRDTPGKPVLLKLLGMPGTQAQVTLLSGDHRFAGATIDGKPVAGFATGQAATVAFPGAALTLPWHRRLGDLAPAAVPADAEALFEATAFAADSDALCYRAVARSGPTRIPAVQAARDAFFTAPPVLDRGVWGGFLFDGNPRTWFRNIGADNVIDSRKCLLRIDMRAPQTLDRLVLSVEGNDAKPGKAEVSADLVHWTAVASARVDHSVVLTIPAGAPVRYVRMDPGDWRMHSLDAYRGQTRLDETGWRASNLFWDYAQVAATAAWSATYTLPEIPAGSYLCVAMEGRHGREGAYAAARIGGKAIGAPNRAPSFAYNQWETSGGQTDQGYTYFIPLDASMVGKPIDVVALTMKNGVNDYQPAVWVTAYPAPYVARDVVLEAGK